MGKRLNITVFGTLYHVGALRLTPDLMRVGIGAYGKADWERILRDIALGQGPKTLAREVVHTIGQPIDSVYSCCGVAMDGHRFGFEVFHGGEFQEVSMVDALNTVVKPAKYMRVFNSEDALGVFWATEEGGLQFRWDNVEVVHQHDVVLAYDNLTPLLALKNNFNLAQSVIWNGKAGRRTGVDFGTGLHAGRHVLHRGT